MDMMTYLWIGVGGFLGANTRYCVNQWIISQWGIAFPYGTLLINLSGSFLLCLVIALLSRSLVLPLSIRLALTTGFLSSYTTFSTFSAEWLQLFQAGYAWWSVLYLLCSILGGGIAGGAGFLLGRLL